MRTCLFAFASFLLACSSISVAQTRDEQVRGDREDLAGNEYWVYNNLEAGIQAARAERKPLLIVFRCIP